MRSIVKELPHIGLMIDHSVSGFMVGESEAKWPKETGGIILGNRSNDGVTILLASGPGPKAKHSIARFTRDGEFAQMFLGEAVQESLGLVDYMGEWHSHTAPAGASWLDRRSMLNIVKNPAYGISEPVMLICVPALGIGSRTWTIRAYQATSTTFTEVQIAPLVSNKDGSP